MEIRRRMSGHYCGFYNYLGSAWTMQLIIMLQATAGFESDLEY